MNLATFQEACIEGGEERAVLRLRSNMPITDFPLSFFFFFLVGPGLSWWDEKVRVRWQPNCTASAHSQTVASVPLISIAFTMGKLFGSWLLQASRKTQDKEKVFGPSSPGSCAQIISWGFPEDVCNQILYGPVLGGRNNSHYSLMLGGQVSARLPVHLVVVA